MKPVIIGNATLYCADCLDVLPTLPKVDAVITDPPYGIDFVQRTTGARITGDDKAFDPAPFLGLAPVSLFWGAENFASRLPAGRWLVWLKRAVEIAAPKSYGDCELAWVSVPGCIKAKRHISDGCIREGEEFGIVRTHPSQKPVAVMQWCMQFAPGETVCDPFMGSGTTGIAALREGRRFIGIEVESEHFETACRRIEQAQAQGKLFEPDLPKPEQLEIE